MKADYPGRLFWKMLLVFLLVFIILSQILWLGFSMFGTAEPPGQKEIRRVLDMQMASAVSALQLNGPQGLALLTEGWPAEMKSVFRVQTDSNASCDDAAALFPVPSGRPPLSVASSAQQDNRDSEAEEPPGSRDARRVPDILCRQVSGPQGQRYTLLFNTREYRHVEPFRDSAIQRFLHLPMPMLILFVPMGLMFSLLLAWNLTRPMRLLREGFRQVSTGDLSVRLYPKMQRRRDELTTVAYDFDAMVERLDRLVKTREELLHDISHELRTPLARLQLATALARQNPENVETSLARIDDEASKLDKMIGELLTLSRAEHGYLEGDQFFDLTSLLDVVVADARFEAQVPQVEIAVRYDDQADYTVQGNAEMIRRCIENILRNALRFSGPGQTISLRLTSTAEWLTLTIADQGPGVEHEKLSSIFDPFVRVQSAQSGKGYGLGLAIVRKVVLAHHGEVRARNRPSGGLEIMLRLPHWQSR